MVRSRAIALVVVLLAGCSPGLWVDDGYYMCITGACPSIAPHCWRDLHCHRTPEVDAAALDDAGADDAAATGDAGPPSFAACSASTPCTAPEICTPLGVCSRPCVSEADCSVGQCTESEIVGLPAYCRPPCSAGCPGSTSCALTRSVSGATATTGFCIEPYTMMGTPYFYRDCHGDAECGPYRCMGEASGSQPGICILPCSTGGPPCPELSTCVATMGAGMPQACLYRCTAATAAVDCIPQEPTPERCESRSGALVCIDADGL
jgi:hypothetical protein